jgi:hypothetical protein
MAQVVYPQTQYQEMPGSASGTSRSSIELYRCALQSIQELQPIISTDRVAIRTFMAFYQDIPEVSSNGENFEENDFVHILPALRKLDDLLTWPEGWNGYDALTPNYADVQYAKHWIELFYREVITSGQLWIDPNVTASADGEVVFEWWYGTKGLTIYIDNLVAAYLKDWGANINTEMEDGYANSPAIRRNLWKWLISQ